MSNRRRRFKKRLSERQKRMKEAEQLPIQKPRREPSPDAIQQMVDSRREEGWAGTVIILVLFFVFIAMVVVSYFWGEYLVNWPG
jgi:hypothetical protein